jgi:hypothetical protein
MALRLGAPDQGLDTVGLRGLLKNRRAVVALFLLPLAIAAALLLYYAVAQEFRYEEAFFTPEYLERYGKIGGLLDDLERALHTGDRELLAGARGTRGTPRSFSANPNVRFAVLLGKEGEYLNYLYYDTTNFRRYHEPVRQVDGRYVVAQLDLYYFMDSGRWLEVWGPIAMLWWLVLLVATGSSWLYRTMERVRRQLFAPLEPD